MKPYSNDLRCRVIQAIQKNEETQAEIAAHFSVSTSFVEKLWHRFLTSGSFEALPHSGGRQRLLKGAEAVIRRFVAEQPDLTLLELSSLVAAETDSCAVSEAVICVELQRLALPRKKSRSTPPSEIASELLPNASNTLRRAQRESASGSSLWTKRGAIWQ